MTLQEKIQEHFDGMVVRKDLTKLVKGNAVVPTYVLEYLLGQYCATFDDELVEHGVEKVKDIITRHYVHREEAELIKSKIKENRFHKIIDRVAVNLNEKRDIYEASFTNLGIKGVETHTDFIKNHPKLLTGGVWCIVDMEYLFTEERGRSPWIIENLKPIQMSRFDFDEYLQLREHFDKEEWIDLLMQSLGFNPEEFGERNKLFQISRLLPFCERNYNIIELGPKGTGKSHVYSEFSPHGILISGGDVSQAKLFVNNSNGKIGLVGYWDTVAFDEFAGKTKRVDRKLVDIMKNYMANKTFSRGRDVMGAEASMVFVGNTDRSVPYMMKHSNLFEALPKGYYDSAFLDRLHFYLPGWEIDKLRSEMFTDGYGFIVDYFAEVLRFLRSKDYTQAFRPYFELSKELTSRDRTAVTKTLSGLIKILYPNGDCPKAEMKKLLTFAMEARRRVKQQLVRMDETFEAVSFHFTDLETGEKTIVKTLEESEYGHFKIQESNTDKANLQAPSQANLEQSATIPPTKIPEETIAEIEETTVLEETLKTIKENQKGISYKKLFADYLEGASEIHLHDPYLQNYHQAKNLMEFCQMVLSIIPLGEEVTLKVFTKHKYGEKREAERNLLKIQEGFEGTGLIFEYDFDLRDSFHDRWIETDHGWKITMGRGLDMFQRYDLKNTFSIAYWQQEARSCREFSVGYHKL